MKLQNRHLKIRPYLLYGFAALVLLVFLGKNTAAYEAHLTDVRNSAGPPLPVGAEVPEFSMEDSDGAILESSQLPETSTLVLAIVGLPLCPGGIIRPQRKRRCRKCLRRLYWSGQQRGPRKI